MLRHLLGLTWLEIKIFLREPMGAIGTILVPIVLFVILGSLERLDSESGSPWARDLPVLITIFTAILASHVAVKMLFTALTLALLALVGRRFYADPPPPNLWSFLVGVVVVTISILSIGFVLASAVPTARFPTGGQHLALPAVRGVRALSLPRRAAPGVAQRGALLPAGSVRRAAARALA